MDEELNIQFNLTSANSINVARFLPQSFYYFYAFAQLAKIFDSAETVFSVPSGNLGNLTAGLFAKQMGLPVKRFIAANNLNDVFFEFLKTGEYKPRPSVQTIANAMDVGAPSNFERILDLYGGSHEKISREIKGFSYNDSQIENTISSLYKRSGYLLDPHSACAYRALTEGKEPGEKGIFLATAHPAKFKDSVERCIDSEIVIPEDLEKFTKKQKHSFSIQNNFNIFKKALINLT